LTVVVDGVYYDREVGEEVLITSIEGNVVRFMYEDGEEDSWEVDDLSELRSFLEPANEIAVQADRSLHVKVKAMFDDTIIPEYKSLGAAGFDLHISEDVTVPALKVVLDTSEKEWKVSLTDNHAVVGTGLAFEIPLGFEMEIRDRSSNMFKDVKILTFNGTIDSDYRGEVKLHLTNLGSEDVHLKKGDRVAQGVIKRIEQVSFIQTDTLSDTARGSGGFGHTGK